MASGTLAQFGSDAPCPRPFLRWAGGKQKLLRYLLPFAPSPSAYRRYFEAFLGGGALFFAASPRRAVLGDINQELILCYKQIASDPDRVHELIRRLSERDSRRFFYGIRRVVPDCLAPPERAARFIYLNKAAFNGVYRVNQLGQFNVPYGPGHKGPVIPSLDQLRVASRALRNARLIAGDFEETVNLARAGDFVYLDPPYPPRSRTAFFNHYSQERFGWQDQLRLSNVFGRLTERGCLVMLSNAGQRKVDELYRGFHIYRLNVVRWVGSNGDRFRAREIVVTNYDPKEVRRA